MNTDHDIDPQTTTLFKLAEKMRLKGIDPNTAKQAVTILDSMCRDTIYKHKPIDEHGRKLLDLIGTIKMRLQYGKQLDNTQAKLLKQVAVILLHRRLDQPCRHRNLYNTYDRYTRIAKH